MAPETTGSSPSAGLSSAGLSSSGRSGAKLSGTVRSRGERSSGSHGRPGTTAGGSPPSRRHCQEVVAAATHFFAAHYGEPIGPGDVARHLGISEARLTVCFEQCRRRSPLQALESFRLTQLFQRVREQPTASLATQVRQCGLPPLAHTDRLFEASFGIGLAPFRYTSRRAAEDRAFRIDHPGPEALVVQPDGPQATPLARNQASSRCQPSAASLARKVGR